ncbi:MAG: ATP-binding protein [Bacteroidales bacterium]|nr:ATP-binding protein [Bacteroidales bacterium]
MNIKNNSFIQKLLDSVFLKKYIRFRSSIYFRVVYIIVLASLVLFVSFGIIFRSVYEDYLRTTILQNGNNIGSMVEGALYHSMLENDKAQLQNTLDIINTMSGIEEVNMYNKNDSLAYSSFSPGADGHSDPNCINCHKSNNEYFPRKKKAYQIVDVDDECAMHSKTNNHRYLLIRSPILNERSCYTAACHAHSKDEDILGSLIIKVPLKQFDEAVHESTVKYYVLAGFSTLLLMTLFIFFTRKKIKNPLNHIISASEKVAGGDRNTRLQVTPNQLDDIRMVSYAFNKMLDNLQAANQELENWSHQLEYKVQKKTEELGAAQKELIHVERIASLGKLSSSVAHEINNPLSGVLTYTKLVSKQLKNQQMDVNAQKNMLKYLDFIEKETKRCGNIVKGLLDFSRQDQEHAQAQHVHQILEETYDLMEHQMEMAHIHFKKDFQAEKDSVYCTENQIKQASVAIIQNASEAVTENGAITIKTHNPDEDHLQIDFIDNGIGIAPEDIPHLFEPFFSAKQKTSGIGLGLAIVHGIIQSHQGKIQIDSEPGAGTTMSVILPIQNQNE